MSQLSLNQLNELIQAKINYDKAREHFANIRNECEQVIASVKPIYVNKNGELWKITPNGNTSFGVQLDFESIVFVEDMASIAVVAEEFKPITIGTRFQCGEVIWTVIMVYFNSCCCIAEGHHKKYFTKDEVLSFIAIK